MGGKAERAGVAPVYGRVLDLRDRGASMESIAIAVGVEVAAVAALIDLAERKLANATADEEEA